MSKVVIVGAGIFGITAAVELAGRGFEVHLLDPGPIPHPDASSTDISKVLRMDYGADRMYMDWMAHAFRIWDEWNLRWLAPLYHETGVLVLSKQQMSPGGFEYESFLRLSEKGIPVERISSDDLQKQFPAWNPLNYSDGYFNPRGGWVESGRVIERLVEDFRTLGGFVHEGVRFESLLEQGGRVVGVDTRDGSRHEADVVVMAAGAWTPALLPDLDGVMWPIAQDVLHFRVSERLQEFQAPLFPVFTADISNTGWYGFPAKADGTLKIAHHGKGRRLDPAGSRSIHPQTEARFRRFLSESFPSLGPVPLIHERVCFYADTFDGNFWISPDPVREGLVVASGGSGHAFKFAPVLGPLIADLVEGKANPMADRFAWRAPDQHKTEDARYEGA